MVAPSLVLVDGGGGRRLAAVGVVADGDGVRRHGGAFRGWLSRGACRKRRWGEGGLDAAALLAGFGLAGGGPAVGGGGQGGGLGGDDENDAGGGVADGAGSAGVLSTVACRGTAGSG